MNLINTSDLSFEAIESIFERANQFLQGNISKTLQDEVVVNIFFENSTRTRSSFEIAAKRLGAKVINLDVAKSSTSKGETLFDTAANLDSMMPSAIVVRHSEAGVPRMLSKHLNCSLINAGDGANAHPTQALLDLFTIRQYFKALQGVRIAIVGDIKNSRVANSNIKLLTRFGLDVTLVAPPHFMPKIDIKKVHDVHEIIDNVDIIMSLRTQTERHKYPMYGSLKDYASDFCITKELVGQRDIILLHPGPVHRNVDIDDDMLSDARSKVLEQVKNGVFVRMAILDYLING